MGRFTRLFGWVFFAIALAGVDTAYAAGPIDLGGLDRVDAQIDVQIGRQKFNRRNGKLTTAIKLTNASEQTLSPPIYLAIENISLPGITVNADGTDINGTPYFVSGAELDSGESVTINVVFSNAGRRRFTYEPSAFAVQAELFVSIEEPERLALIGAETTDVSGKMTAGAEVTVNGIDAVVAGDTWTVPGLLLVNEGTNVVTALAVDGDGRTATVSTQYTRDTTPPTVVITSPLDGKTVFNDTISVTGTFIDPVSGLLSESAPTATVNGQSADVLNGAFVFHGLTLVSGVNTITAEVTDPAGNAAEVSVDITYDDAAVKKLEAFSGNDQSAPISTPLANQLVAKVFHEDGTVAAGQDVVFRVVQSNGVFDDGTRVKLVQSDENGCAAANFIVGSRTGQGCNRVEATSTGFQGTAVFISTSQGGTPAKINVTQGEMQTGEVGLEAPMTLVARVTDIGNNALSGVLCHFTVTAGGGHFKSNDSNMLVATTDAVGRVRADFVLGPIPGVDANLIEATIDGFPDIVPAIFALSGVESGNPDDTTFSGVVLDHTDNPLQGATVDIDGFDGGVLTNAQGQFIIGPGVPVGPAHLHVDGSTVQRPGHWASLAFEVTVIAGIENTLGMPVHLLPLSEDCPIANPDTDVTVALPEIDGFSLRVFAGSATFPDGSKTGKVGVTQVRTDKIPMPPPDGMSPNFIITIQPPGVHFDPPAQATYPNVEGLAPGEETNLYSFDHDLGRFVTIGPGTVSDDGTVITSNPGYGVVKGGWHCAGPSRPQGHASPVMCVITLNKNVTVKVNENVAFAAAGTPVPGTMAWTGGDTPATGSGNTFNTKFTKCGTFSVTATYTCESGAKASDTATVQVIGDFKMQFQCGGTWQDVPPGGFKGVCPGSKIDLRVVAVGGGALPAGFPTWGGLASGTGPTKQITVPTGNHTVSAQCSTNPGDTLSFPACGDPANAAVAITWPAADLTQENTAGDTVTTTKPFVIEYTACCDIGNNVWRLRVKKNTGGVRMVIKTGGSRNAGTNPPVSQAEAVQAVNVMKGYLARGSRGAWHTAAATIKHENYHYSEWQCSADHYWPTAETKIETLTIPYKNAANEAAAIALLRAGANGADAIVLKWRIAAGNYYGSLPDNANSRPYAAGQESLNTTIMGVQTLAATKGWVVPAGTTAHAFDLTKPCFKVFPAFNP